MSQICLKFKGLNACYQNVLNINWNQISEISYSARSRRKLLNESGKYLEPEAKTRRLSVLPEGSRRNKRVYHGFASASLSNFNYFHVGHVL